MIWADLIPLVIATIYVVVVFIISEKVLKIFIMPFFSDVWGMLILTVPTTIVLFFLTDYSPIKIENKVTESGHVLGLFFYALIWSVLLLIFNGNNLWIVAMAIAALVYGDGFAALIGSKFGRIKYTIWGGEKSLEGSLAMFVVVAVVSVFVWMFYVGGTWNLCNSHCLRSGKLWRHRQYHSAWIDCNIVLCAFNSLINYSSS